MSSAIEYLQYFLTDRPSGLIPVKDLVPVLSLAWGDLSSTDRHRTYASKLHRIEEPEWDRERNLLTFKLERHGRTVNGSSRADLHYWQVSFAPPQAIILKSGHRQLSPMAKRFNAKKVAEEVAQSILTRETKDFLVWEGDQVEILISQLIPDNASTQAVTSRRRKFREHLHATMTKQGWIAFEARYRRPGWKVPPSP